MISFPVDTLMENEIETCIFSQNLIDGLGWSDAEFKTNEDDSFQYSLLAFGKQYISV